jgi:hypothetical protein
MERITKDQAQKRVAAFEATARAAAGGLAVELDWSNPMAEALRITRLRPGATARLRFALDEIVDTLLAYQSHLDYEAGRAAERAEVPNTMPRTKKAPDVRVGDVWTSRTGRNKIRVNAIDAPGFSNRAVHWTSLTIHGDGTNSHGHCYLGSFPRGRRLVERDGTPVEA